MIFLKQLIMPVPLIKKRKKLSVMPKINKRNKYNKENAGNISPAFHKLSVLTFGCCLI